MEADATCFSDSVSALAGALMGSLLNGFEVLDFFWLQGCQRPVGTLALVLEKQPNHLVVGDEGGLGCIGPAGNPGLQPGFVE